MKLPITNDNKYKIGTKIAELAHPDKELIIKAYKSRIYYCAFVEFPDKKELALFEREIILLKN